MVESFYDSTMAAQQNRLASTPDMAQQRARIVSMLQPMPGETVLELGTGNGALLRDLGDRLAPGGKAVGLDSSLEMLEIARRIAPDAEFILGSASALPFPSRHFDAVCAAQLLCFLPEVDRALGEAFRVLRPGGRVVLLDTDWATLVWHSRRPDLMRRVVDVYVGHYAHPYLPRGLAPRLAAAGFDRIACESLVVLNSSLSADSYARQTLDFAVSIMKRDPRFAEADVDAFVFDQEVLDDADAAFFSLNRYLFSAHKPPDTAS